MVGPRGNGSGASIHPSLGASEAQEGEIELGEERPHVRNGVRQLRSNLREVPLLGRASSRARARLLGPGGCCERYPRGPQRREAEATREPVAERSAPPPPTHSACRATSPS